MTIAARRRIFWILFAFAASLAVLGLVLVLPVLGGEADYSRLDGGGGFRTSRLLSLVVESPSGSATGMLFSSFLSLATLGFILLRFRKTASSEIFAFAFWALSLSLEAGRGLCFRLAEAGRGDAWIEALSRLVIGGRYAGFLFLFVAGLYAAGFRGGRPGSAVLVAAGVAGGLAAWLPLDSGLYLPTFIVKPGFPELGWSLLGFAAVLTPGNFLRAARVSGDRSYAWAGAGAFAAATGGWILQVSWRPLPLAAGLLLAAIGSWVFVSRLHAYYLWQ